MRKTKTLVHPLSYKLMMTEFATDEPNTIEIPDNFPEILIASNPFLRKKSRGIDQPINIISKEKLNSDSGHILFFYHKQKCFEYMLNGLDHNTPASQCLQNWYNINELDDDDYDSETMYREWTRWYKRKISGYRHPYRRPLLYKIKPNAARIDEIIQKTVAKHVLLFFNNTKTWNYGKINQFYAYMYVRCSIHVKIAHSTLYDREFRFKHFLKQHPNVKKTIDALLLP